MTQHDDLQKPNQCPVENLERLSGHAWFRFVDPNLDERTLNSITAILDAEYRHLFTLVAEQEAQLE